MQLRRIRGFSTDVRENITYVTGDPVKTRRRHCRLVADKKTIDRSVEFLFEKFYIRSQYRRVVEYTLALPLPNCTVRHFVRARHSIQLVACQALRTNASVTAEKTEDVATLFEEASPRKAKRAVSVSGFARPPQYYHFLRPFPILFLKHDNAFFRVAF